LLVLAISQAPDKVVVSVPPLLSSHSSLSLGMAERHRLSVVVVLRSRGTPPVPPVLVLVVAAPALSLSTPEVRLLEVLVLEALQFSLNMRASNLRSATDTNMPIPKIAAISVVLFLLLVVPCAAFAQTAILQGGPWQPGHLSAYTISNSQPVMIDSGPASGGAIGTGVSELAISARGTGLPPYIGQGTGPFGSVACLYDGPITSSAGYHWLCFSANATGNVGLISFGASGGAASIALNWNINGVAITPVSCSGSPSSSFAAINGIVTHC
jgi:hypothetical protein